MLTASPSVNLHGQRRPLRPRHRDPGYIDRGPDDCNVRVGYGTDGTVWYTATRQIHAGEELFVHYGVDYWLSLTLGPYPNRLIAVR